VYFYTVPHKQIFLFWIGPKIYPTIEKTHPLHAELGSIGQWLKVASSCPTVKEASLSSWLTSKRLAFTTDHGFSVVISTTINDEDVIFVFTLMTLAPR
jgi:hypothetical protein